MGEVGCTCPCRGTCPYALYIAEWRRKAKEAQLTFHFDIPEDLETKVTNEDGIYMAKTRRRSGTRNT